MTETILYSANCNVHMENPPTVSLFNDPDFGDIRIIEKSDGGLWFVAADVCSSLELENVSQALNSLDEDEKGTVDANIITNDVQGGRAPLIISEPGLYSLILRSRKSKAKKFKRWITHEVIPSIRQHGAYLTPSKIEEVLADPDTIIKLATDLKAERQKRAALEQQATLDRPKVVFADSIEVSKDTILIGELAKIIHQSTGYNIGQNRLFEYLRSTGYLHRSGSQRNLPTQKSVNAGLMVIKEGSRLGADGEARITKTTKITGKGQIYFVNRFQGAALAEVAI